MNDDLPVSGVIPVSHLTGEDEDEMQRLWDMARKAQDFISEFEWCRGIVDLYFGAGIGDVFAVFLAHINPARAEVDRYLWIVVGDIPSAYLVTDDCPNPQKALEGYIREMRKWVVLAKQNRNSKEVIPVNAPSTPEWAVTLEKRLNKLEEEIIPLWFAPSNRASVP